MHKTYWVIAELSQHLVKIMFIKCLDVSMNRHCRCTRYGYV